MNPWVAFFGVFVLVNAAMILHPLLGLIVAFTAGFIGFRRWMRRSKRDRG